MKLIIVRHGETEDNLDGIVTGQSNAELSKKGMEQAKLLAERLKNEKIDFIYCSDLKRTKDTLSGVLKYHHVPVVYDPLLREKTQGTYDGKSEQEYQEFREKYRHIARWRPPKGENFYDVKKRARMFTERLLRDHKPTDTILVISHNGWKTIFFSYLLGISRLKAFTNKFDNTAVSIVELSQDGNHQVKLMNCTRHLDTSK